jgi:predicted ATPase
MLTKMRVQNFKAWKDTGSFRLAPLTVLFGANSAGKSSLGHLLLALKQTAISADRRRAFHTGDSNSLIDLGTFAELVHGHERTATLGFGLEWKLREPLTVRNALKAEEEFTGDKLRLDVSMEANASTGQPEVRRISYDLLSDETTVLDARISQEAQGNVDLSSKHIKLSKAVGRGWPLDSPEKFYRLSDRSIARYRNAAFLTDFALATEDLFQGLSYLGPLREPPRPTYAWAGNSPDSVGQRGETTIAAILAADAEKRTMNRGRNTHYRRFSEFIAEWLVELRVIADFKVKQAPGGRKDYDVLVKTHGSSAAVRLPDVGFGVSQLLPALVQAFYCPPGSVVWMEQPEIHLHPRVQSNLADAFICAIQARDKSGDRNVQLVVETHSEHFLNRLQRRIAEEIVRPDEVAIYFCKRTGASAELVELEIDRNGEISNWPEGFFGDEMEDLVKRTEAAARRTGNGEAR